MTRATRALKSHDLSGEGNMDHMHTFFDYTRTRRPLRMRDRLNNGAPQRQHEHERLNTPFTQPFILTSLKLPGICLTGEEKPVKKYLTQETCPDRGSKSGPLRVGSLATACPTAVDYYDCIICRNTYNKAVLII